MRHWYVLILFLSSLLALAGTAKSARSQVSSEKDKSNPTHTTPTFQTEIGPLFLAKCGRCHGDKVRKADLVLTTVAGVLKGGETGPAIVAGKPDESLLYKKVLTGAMPPGKKDRLSETELTRIRRWIAEGARSDTGTTSKIVREKDAPPTQADALPIFMRHCTPCHGAHRQEAGLDLRSRSAMFRGGKSGAALVPGRPEESLIIKRVREGAMPPRDRFVEACVKPVEPGEAEILVRWIASGAREVPLQPDVATKTPDTQVTDKEREFWAFRPPRPVAIPVVKNRAQVRNPLDAFVLEKLEAKGLTLAQEADRATLLRRACLDLTGLLPEPDILAGFLADPAPDAFERMIDVLLASPRYGERWGRFWLDLAGYADSEGKREQDLPRPHAWRFRDYVIRALNDDKPYDRFLLEQLAGDELADYEHAPEITQELYDNLVATGFLRMAPDPTWANITGFIPERLEVIADEMDVLGSAVMGLSLKCARCHDHKFDPIPQRDYYRMVANFKGAYDEYDWLKPDVRPGLGPISQDVVGGRHLPHVTTVERRRWEAHNAEIQQKIAALRSSVDQKADALAERIREERLAKLPEVLRSDLRRMLATPPSQRDQVQRYLADKFEKQLRISREALPALDPVFKAEADKASAQIKALEGQRLPEPRIQALWDRGEPSPTHIYRRGDPQSPGHLVGPGVPSVLTDGKTPFEVEPPWPGAKQTGRRLAFARWLIRPDHPLTARVEVNRLWKRHFGSGLVATLGNFGKAGSAPTHPELLDWLAREFVRQGWSRKAMHRLIMTSATYRQTSVLEPEQERRDPTNALYSRMPLARMDAEALYDTFLQVAGRLDETPFGPGDLVQVRQDGLVTPAGTARGWRRLVYVLQTRKQVPTHLENFDFPAMNPNCIERRDSTVAPQALYLMNNAMIDQLAAGFAQRVRREAGFDRASPIQRVYWIAFGRRPTREEEKTGMDAMRKLVDAWSGHLPGSGQLDPEQRALKALATYCHAIMNSADFLFID